MLALCDPFMTFLVSSKHYNMSIIISVNDLLIIRAFSKGFPEILKRWFHNFYKILKTVPFGTTYTVIAIAVYIELPVIKEFR